MEKIIKIRCIYNRRNKLDKKGLAPVELELYHQRQRKWISTGIMLSPKDWDFKREKIKHCVTLIEKEKYLIEKQKEVETIILKNPQMPLVEIYNQATRQQINTFSDFYKSELESELTATGTQKNELCTLKHLQDYKQVVNFQDLNYNFLCAFEKYLYQKKGLKTNTIHKIFRHLKKYANIAIKKGYMDKSPFLNFRAKTETTNRTFLETFEIEKMERINETLPNGTIKHTLEHYLFSVYTGLRFSDVATLTKSDIIDTDNGKAIFKTMIKTDKKIYIPISKIYNGKPLQIIEKYLFGNNGQTIFPKQTNQTANRCLKEIAKLCDIDKKLTFHTARHTNATDLLRKNVPITTIQKLLGHTKLETTMIYEHITNQQIDSDINKIFENEI